jgi:hypothetical protein
MPYINENDRDYLRPTAGIAGTPGELNFQITCLVTEYLATHGYSYSTINDIVGAIEGSKLEFYRRVAAPYEEAKIEANGDVYADD